MSRRRRAGIIAVCFVLVVLVIWLDHSSVKRLRDKQPKSQQQVKASDFEKYHAKTFAVANVVDGDTIDIDIGDGSYPHTRIRLWGVDTPETKKPDAPVGYFGPEASEFTSKLVLGKRVAVYLEKGRTRGKYGRLLAYIRLPDNKFLNEVLIAEGFGYADLRFRHSFYNEYKQLESAARSQKKGLWEKVTREQLPEWLRRMKPKLL